MSKSIYWYQDSKGNFLPKMGTFEVDRSKGDRISGLLETMHEIATRDGLEVWSGSSWTDESDHARII